MYLLTTYVAKWFTRLRAQELLDSNPNCTNAINYSGIFRYSFLEVEY